MDLITALTDRVTALEKSLHHAAPSTRASSLTLTNTEVSSDEEEGGIAVDSMSLIPKPKKALKRYIDTPTLIAKREELARLKRQRDERLGSMQPKPTLRAASTEDLKTHLKPIRDELSLLTGCVFGIERRLKSLMDEAGTEPFFRPANGLAVKSLATKYEGFKSPTLKSPPKNFFTNTLSMPSSSVCPITTTTASNSELITKKPCYEEKNPIFRLGTLEGFKPKAIVPEKSLFTGKPLQVQQPLTLPTSAPTATLTLPPSQLPKPTTRPASSTQNTPKALTKRPLSLSGSSSTPRRPSTLRNITNTSNASTVITSTSTSSPFSNPEVPRSVIFGQPSTPSLPPKYNFDFNVSKSPFGGYAKTDAGNESPFSKLPKASGNSKKRLSLSDGRPSPRKAGGTAGNGSGKVHPRVSWLDTAMLHVSLDSGSKTEGTMIPRSSPVVGMTSGPTWPTVFAPKDGAGSGAKNGKEKENDAKRVREGPERGANGGVPREYQYNTPYYKRFGWVRPGLTRTGSAD